MKTLRDNLGRLMDARGWSQRTLAAKSGVSQSAIGYTLRYRDPQDKRPGIQNIELVAKAFGVQAWQLLCPVDAQPAPEPLDEELLVTVISAAAEAFRARGALPDDHHLAAAAVFMYRRVRDGANLKRAADAVGAQIDQIGTDLARIKAPQSTKGGRQRGDSGKGNLRKGETRAE